MQETINKYEVQIKVAILLLAALLFTYSSLNNYSKTAVNYYEHTNTK